MHLSGMSAVRLSRSTVLYPPLVAMRCFSRPLQRPIFISPAPPPAGSCPCERRPAHKNHQALLASLPPCVSGDCSRLEAAARAKQACL